MLAEVTTSYLGGEREGHGVSEEAAGQVEESLPGWLRSSTRAPDPPPLTRTLGICPGRRADGRPRPAALNKYKLKDLSPSRLWQTFASFLPTWEPFLIRRRLPDARARQVRAPGCLRTQSAGKPGPLGCNDWFTASTCLVKNIQRRRSCGCENNIR